MEMVSIPKKEYEMLKLQVSRLRRLEKVDFNLVKQFKESLDDVEKGRVRKVA